MPPLGSVLARDKHPVPGRLAKAHLKLGEESASADWADTLPSAGTHALGLGAVRGHVLRGAETPAQTALAP